MTTSISKQTIDAVADLNPGYPSLLSGMLGIYQQSKVIYHRAELLEYCGGDANRNRITFQPTSPEVCCNLSPAITLFLRYFKSSQNGFPTNPTFNVVEKRSHLSACYGVLDPCSRACLSENLNGFGWNPIQNLHHARWGSVQ